MIAIIEHNSNYGDLKKKKKQIKNKITKYGILSWNMKFLFTGRGGSEKMHSCHKVDRNFKANIHVLYSICNESNDRKLC